MIFVIKDAYKKFATLQKEFYANIFTKVQRPFEEDFMSDNIFWMP